MSKKWAEICKILQKKCTEAQFKVWIEPLLFRCSEQEVTLLAPSQYVADFLNSRFYAMIYDTLCDTYGKKCSLVIISPENEGTLNFRSTNAISFSSDKADYEHQEKTDPKNLKEKQSIKNEPLPPTEKQLITNRHRVACDPRPLIKVQKNESVDARPLPRPLPAAQMMLPVTAPVKAKFFWKHSFNDFIVGSSNELAYVASKSMCNNTISSDVLFLNSPAGLGKTHLLQSVGKTLCEQSNLSSPKVEYLTAEEFASQFYFSLKSQSTDRFKERYRGLDLLLLEDVHFLQGKEKLQAELLATIKALSHRRGKVIFTSSFSARDLTQMDEQLQSRICSGFMSSIDRPDENTRREIFRKKASLYQVKLPEEVEEMLAHYIKKDVRQIESCLHNLVLKARLFKCGITMQMAWEVICNFAAESPILDMSGIISFVCRGFGVSREQLSSLSRKKEYVVARNTIFFLARKHTDLSLEAIGKNFNRRHSTVLKGITNIEREMSRDTPLGKQVTNTVSMIERNGNLVNTNFPI